MTNQINWVDRLLYSMFGQLPNKPGVANFLEEKRKKYEKVVSVTHLEIKKTSKTYKK